MADRFAGKVAVITGAGVGIGRAIAEAFVAEGASVAVVDRDGAAADAVADAIGRERALAVTTDITSQAETRAMAATVADHFGRLDVLVNNAGVRFIAPFAEMSLETWQSTLDVNLTGSFLCIQAVLPTMLGQGRGKVVNVASTTGILALTKRSAYAASKAGIIGLTKSLAYELSAQGIWVNAVAPGPTETPMNARYFDDEEMRGILRKEIPLGRWGQPHEIAAAILFLASDESDYVCGAVLEVDGGWLSGKGY